jgi:carbonic anhydrase
MKKIFENNRKWVAERLAQDENYFKRLAEGQSPEILYIGCSDSRVSAETIMGTEPGEVFVHRNIANLVPNTDLNVMSVINYAVCHLKVKHIVVCGHYHCGGVAAAVETTDFGVLNPWLRNIRDVYRLYAEELDAYEDDEAKQKRLIEYNVYEQCLNVLKINEVQKAVAERDLKVHGWIFDIESGLLKDMQLDYRKMLDTIKSIYPTG